MLAAYPGPDPTPGVGVELGEHRLGHTVAEVVRPSLQCSVDPPGQPVPWWWSPLRGQVLVWIIPSGAARSRAPAAAVCDGWDEMRVRAVLVSIDPA